VCSWDKTPKKVPRFDKPQREKYSDFDVTTKAQLKKCTKEELVGEVNRLQSHIRNVAVELGIARRTPSSEHVIDPQFVGNIIALIRAAWSFNL